MHKKGDRTVDDHECCESCVQDIAAGYGDDLIYLGICCCEAENDRRREKAAR